MGVEKRMYIFHNVPCDTLGLMHSVRHLHDNRPNRSTCFSFTHLTLQEYLAAYHWSQLPPKQLTELLQQQDLFPIQQYLRGIQRNEWIGEEILQVTHWPVLLFLAGLTRFSSILPELITPADKLLKESSSTCSSVNGRPIDPSSAHPCVSCCLSLNLLNWRPLSLMELEFGLMRLRYLHHLTGL